MTLSYIDVISKAKTVSVFAIIGGLIYGMIIATLLIGCFPIIGLTLLSGSTFVIFQCVALAIAVLVTIFMIIKVKQLNKAILDYKATAEKTEN